MKRLRAIKDFSSTVHGNVVTDQLLLKVEPGLANHYIQNGLAVEETYDTKVVREVPSVAGAEKPSQSLPADPAPKKKTRKRRKKKDA